MCTHHIHIHTHVYIYVYIYIRSGMRAQAQTIIITKEGGEERKVKRKEEGGRMKEE